MAAKCATPLRSLHPQRFGRIVSRRLYSNQRPTVAVLFQDIDPPVINGVRKPRKPGGECMIVSCSRFLLPLHFFLYFIFFLILPLLLLPNIILIGTGNEDLPRLMQLLQAIKTREQISPTHCSQRVSTLRLRTLHHKCSNTKAGASRIQRKASSPP